jgi:hypothetical protein
VRQAVSGKEKEEKIVEFHQQPSSLRRTSNEVNFNFGKLSSAGSLVLTQARFLPNRKKQVRDYDQFSQR